MHSIILEPDVEDEAHMLLLSGNPSVAYILLHATCLIPILQIGKLSFGYSEALFICPPLFSAAKITSIS